MFKWLADMLVKTPVQSSCSCCENKKHQLQKMQNAIAKGEIEGDAQNPDEAVMNCDTPEHEYTGKIFGSAFYGGYPVEVKDCSEADAEEEEHSCSCGGQGCCHK